MPIHFYQPGMLLGLLLIPIAAALFIYAAYKRKKAIQAFGGGALLVSHKREAVGGCTALALIVIALAQPAWNLQEHHLQESGRDVIFLLDVSRSMLADDLHPNRLENSKTAILDCVEELSGDRVALVLFAGSAEIRCPLTVDYDYFRMALRQAAPHSVGAGGTMIGHALERAVAKLTDPQNAGMQDLILITDGGDLIKDPDEIDAIKALNEAGVRFIAIGLGDRAYGSRIAIEDEETGVRSFMKHGNIEVWTKLHSETLRRMAGAAHDGLYFDVANGPFNLAQIYRQIMENAPQGLTDQLVLDRYEEKFHWFLVAAVGVLFLSHRWRTNR